MVVSLQENVEIPHNRIEYIYHVGSSQYRKSVIQSGLIAGRKDSKEGRHTASSTAVELKNEPQRDEPHDVKQFIGST